MRSRSLTADSFSRLTSRTVSSGTVQNYTYSYDRYGNRLTQTPLQTGYTFDPTINGANNRITTSGFTYDAAGNMTNDTVHAYTYDAEGNLLQVDGGSTAVYVFDALNRRVHVQTASGTNEFAYDYAGRRISTWLSPNNSGTEGRIYWDRQQIGYRSTDGTTYFGHQDTLGTERMRTNYGGSVGSTYLSLPWGDGYTATVNNSGADQDNEHFVGLEHAQFRNYASAQGRWLAPDSYMGSYDLTNPESFNRYGYVFTTRLALSIQAGCIHLLLRLCPIRRLVVMAPFVSLGAAAAQAAAAWGEAPRMGALPNGSQLRFGFPLCQVITPAGSGPTALPGFPG